MINKNCLNNVESILHLGACNGEEIKSYKNHNIKKAVFVEANPQLIPALYERCIKAGYNIYDKAIFNQDNKIVDFNIIYSDDKTNKGCSSLLNLKEHANEYPHIKKIKTIKCNTITIDTLVNIYGKFDLLNMDLQGAEMIALEGAKNTLFSFKYIYTEVNFKELYENCILFNNLKKYLEENKFKLLELYKVTESWGDALFINTCFGENCDT